MSDFAYALLGVAVFLFFVATGQAIPNLDSMIINFQNLGEGTQLLYQVSLLVIGFAAALILMSEG